MISSVHIISSKGSGGAELFFVRLANALAESGQFTTAITAPGSGVSAGLRADLPQVHIPMRSAWDLLSRWQIGRTLGHLQADIVQTYMNRATQLTRLVMGRRSIHVARLGGYYNLKNYWHAHAWVGNTKGICDYLVKHGLPAARVACIGNFVTIPPQSSPELLTERRRQLCLPEDALILVAVGRLHPVKGFEDLLAAFAMLAPTCHDRPLYLIIVGDGPLNSKLREYADQLGVSERVRWTGWQAEPGVYYELAELCVCPSRYEPLGNVLLEAWAHRRPVLSTRTAGALELTTQGEDAWMVPPEQPRDLATGIRHLLEDDRLREHLAVKGRDKAQTQYSQQNIVSAYLDFYAELLRR